METLKQTEGQEQPIAEAEQLPARDSQIVWKLHQLPDQQKSQVLDFVDFLVEKYAVKRPRKSIRGLWKDLGIVLTEEEIAEARREMWGTFPRDDF